MTSFRVSLLAGVCGFALAVPSAFAQGEERDVIEVTAQLRTQSVQDVPISLEVIGADELAENNLNSLIDVQETTPSLNITRSGRGDYIYIRGIGSGTNSSFDQSVGMFIDGVYHGRSRTSTGAFLDVDRIEVLKGPQSTYFGNNSIAGAISIITATPGDEFEGWARALYGQDGQYAVEAAVGGPITDTFGIRLAAGVNGMDGWVENINTGKNEPDTNNVVGRITLAYQPAENFDVTAKVSAGQNKVNNGYLLQVDECPPSAPYTPAGFCGPAIGLGVPGDADLDQTASSDGQILKLDTLDAVITANYGIGDHTLTAVSGWFEYDFDFKFDADGLPISGIHTQQPESYDQFSQELRLISPTGGMFEYVAGAYYHTSSLDADTKQSLFILSPTIAAAVPPLAPYLPLGVSIPFTQDERTLSAFGALTWNVNDQLSVTGAVRYSNVRKDFTWSLFYATVNDDYGDYTPLPEPFASIPAALGTGTPGDLSGDRTDDAWMPSARIEYDVSDDAMVYASYSRGFKAGGFNSAYEAGEGIDINEIVYDPEFVDAYEIGLKSTWFDGAVLFNLALFRSEYDDLQVTSNVLSGSGASYIGLVRNAAQSVSQGVEVETSWDVTPDFTLSGSMTYLDAHYENYTGASLTLEQRGVYAGCLATNVGMEEMCDPLQFQDLSGSRTPFSPEWSGTVSGEYGLDLPGDFRLTTNLTALITSGYSFSDNLDPGVAQDSYTRLDARMTLELPGDRWKIDVIGQNLTDKDILSFITNYPNSAGSFLLQRQQPRNFSVQLRYQW